MAKKTIKAEILTAVTSRYHGSIFLPAAEGDPPNVVEWPVDDSEESQEWLKGMERLDAQGFIKIVKDEPKKAAGKLESKSSEVKS